jgi:NADPH:quinone reductase-like Zn-dependent oxidoreductase
MRALAMQAIVYREYGEPDVLELQDVERPIPGDGEVLVRVRAAAVNPGDWDLLHGVPYVLRLSTGLRRPRNRVLGLAVSGQVEAVGRGAEDVRPGDDVFAEVTHGGFAEYVLVPAKALAPKPANLTFEQAAAVPLVGTTALQGLRDIGRVQPGQRVLVIGASGGVGVFAVQIAKVLGAEVTGVCGTRNVDLVRSLGADRVVDYAREDFTAGGPAYDLILDNVGNRSLADCRRALARKGTLIPNSNKGGGRWLGAYVGRAIRSLLLSPFVSQRLRPFAATGKRDDLVALTELIESGQVRPVIDRTYPLAEVPAALRHYGTGHARGKIVISVAAGAGVAREETEDG